MSSTPTKRPYAVSFALLLLTPLLGIVVRFAPLGLPWSLRKYGGSVLWAAMLYWVLSTLLARMRIPQAACLATSVAYLVEFFKRYHIPWVDSFRDTLPGVLLLGRQFSIADLVAYTLAIAAAAQMDARLLRHAQRK